MGTGAGIGSGAFSSPRLPKLFSGFSSTSSSTTPPLRPPELPAPPRPPEPPPCRFGATCYNWDPEHRRHFTHPTGSTGVGGVFRACKYEATCRDTNLAHLQVFVHPGDRNYRNGLVVFSHGSQPVFDTLWQLFSFFDHEETGYLKKEDFFQLLQSIMKSPDSGLLDSSWCDAGGESTGSVNFPRFALWAEAFPLNLPVGLDGAGECRPCRCVVHTNDVDVRDFRCSCAHYRSVEGSIWCECGHKASMHRSDAAEGSAASLGREVSWVDDGLVEVRNSELLQSLQSLLDATHKASDSWTRDRGCLFHGVNGEGCSLSCAFKHQVQVPQGYLLRKAYRNQNRALWARYCIARSFIGKECEKVPAFEQVPVASGVALPELPSLDRSCNEWRLFHGTRHDAARDICSMNFRPALAGSGATWKATGEQRGAPLYGFGVYFAERITKADEYAEMFKDAELNEAVYSMLVVRCIGGRTNVVTTNEVVPEALRRTIFDGPNHSILGDRVSTLRKPYREVVIYDRDQCFPEFLLLYDRH